MNCPKCGGPMWDNRTTKQSPRQPDYKCKNKQCANAIWLDKNTPEATAPSNGTSAAANHPSPRPLGPLYNECLTFARGACKYHFGETAAYTPADVIAMTATLFIQACRDGGEIRASKPVAPPPMPTPPPQPEPAPLPF